MSLMGKAKTASGIYASTLQINNGKLPGKA